MPDYPFSAVVLQGIGFTTLAYWSAVGWYTLIPILFPKYAAQYKLQTNARPIPVRTHIFLILLTLFNQSVIPFAFFSGAAELFFAVGRPIPLILDFPVWYVVVMHFVVYAITFEILFYASHRLLHTRLLYRWVHSLHHRFRAPVPYSGACVHPVEFVVSYLFPNVLAAILFDFSVPEYILFFSLEFIHNVHDHCGYDYPWDPFGWLCGQNVRVHDEHHRLFRVNYSGAFTMILDRLFGTYRAPQRQVTKSS